MNAKLLQEDVLHLVELSKDMRRHQKDSLPSIQWQHEVNEDKEERGDRTHHHRQTPTPPLRPADRYHGYSPPEINDDLYPAESLSSIQDIQSRMARDRYDARQTPTPPPQTGVTGSSHTRRKGVSFIEDLDDDGYPIEGSRRYATDVYKAPTVALPTPGIGGSQEGLDNVARNDQKKQIENLARLKSIGQEEQYSFLQQSMPDIPMSSHERQKTAQRLQIMVDDMSKIGRGLSTWYSLTGDDDRARLFFRAVSEYEYPTSHTIRVVKD